MEDHATDEFLDGDIDGQLSACDALEQLVEEGKAIRMYEESSVVSGTKKVEKMNIDRAVWRLYMYMIVSQK